jgi:hypothetical protein
MTKMNKILILLSFVTTTLADLRMASQPKAHGNKKPWQVQQRNRHVPFVTAFSLYMEPSDFNYDGLKKQRDGGGYDNFLRSNIDNEQDKRNFKTEPGKDHLPFRSYETAANDAGESTVKHKMDTSASLEDIKNGKKAGNYIYATPGEPFDIPLRWNNPHSSELEVNIWVMNKGGPYVIPVKKPTCSGEGYQDNAFTFTVPSDFTTKASCERVGDCVLQIYAHSVESRMYASGTPIIVAGSTGRWAPGTIRKAEKDVAFNLAVLRRLCLPSTSLEANHPNTIVYEARLSSDVYNHAYQNSDFSPYAGQQPLLISQNLQAACILKMTTGNFGELGKEYMQKVAPEARMYAKKLDKKARNLIRRYETTTNTIIENIKEKVANNATLESIGTCKGDGTWYLPLDMAGQGRTQVSSAYECQLRCSQTSGCKFYNYFADGGCHVTDGTADPSTKIHKYNPTVSAGRPDCGRAPQRLENCFRCGETGSTKVYRQDTNTYIPSFEIRGTENVNKALRFITPAELEAGFLTHPDTGKISQRDDEAAILQIYMAVLYEMWPEFQAASSGAYLQKYHEDKYDNLVKAASENVYERQAGVGSWGGKCTCPNGQTYDVGDNNDSCGSLACVGGVSGECTSDGIPPEARGMAVVCQDNNAMEKYQFHYRGPVLKSTLETLADEMEYLKKDQNNEDDNGYYAAKLAWKLQALDSGSSTRVPQNKQGPLDNEPIKPSKNMAAKYANVISPKAPNQKFTFPPEEEVNAKCTPIAVQQLQRRDELGPITEEGEDMDGLNKDADCDNDAFVEEKNRQHDLECSHRLKEDANYICPQYPEWECFIEGENEMLGTQLFPADGAAQRDDSTEAVANFASRICLATSSLGVTVAAILLL